ncbi:MAG TPA: efflux RND transporter periplasmic adaptor subunit, partial [Pseudoduganella sp.]
MKRAAIISLSVAAALAASGAAYWAGLQRGRSAPSAQAPQAAGQDARKPLYWHDPMVPGQRFDKPGKSPFMDMELVPVYADDAASSGIAIDDRTRQNLGVRTAEAREGQLASAVDAVGTVAWDESRVALVQARSSGIVERLFVRVPFAQVRKGQPLAELYVPDFVAAQEEYLAARRLQAEGMSGVADAARQRMRLAGMTEEQIQAVERSGKVNARVTVTAPESAVVAELSAREGMAVSAGAALFKLNGTGSAWVIADVAEGASAGLAAGAKVQLRAAALPGEVLEGRVSAILPDIDPATRTRKVRIELPNPGMRLVPGMFANVSFAAPAARKVLLAPAEAVIRTGKRNVVFVESGEGRFEPVEVGLGAESGGQVEIRSGVKAGQRVVTSSQFLVDSEASL